MVGNFLIQIKTSGDDEIFFSETVQVGLRLAAILLPETQCVGITGVYHHGR